MTNRVTPYEAGWLTFLVSRGLATEQAAREAQNRVAQEAVRALEARRAKRAAEKKKRRKED